MPSIPPVESVRRSFAILEALGTAPALGVKQVAERTKLTPSTAHRLLITLVDCGYVMQDARTGRYQLAGKLVELAGRVPDRFADLRAAARASLEALREETGETANLVTLDGRDVVYIDQAEGSRSVRMFTQPGQRVLSHTTGSGKAILAYRDARELASLFPDALERLTPKTIRTRAALTTDLAGIRRRGYAIDHEEHEDGVSCVAAAVVSAFGRSVDAPSTSCPTPRIINASTAKLGNRVRRAAEATAALLDGGRAGKLHTV
jgi:IclR family transcriptional regulator, acetate operon repressor